MTRRSRILLIALPLVVLAVIGLGAWSLLHSEAGARWLLEQARSATGGALEVRTLRGTLAGGLQLEDLSYRTPGVELEVGRARLQADWTAWPFGVELREGQAGPVTLRLSEGPEGPGRTLEERLAGLALPFPMTVRDLQVTDLQVQDAAGDTVQRFDRIEAAGRWHESLDDLDIRVAGPDLRGTLAGHVDLRAPFDHALAVEGLLPETGQEFRLALEGTAERTRVRATDPGSGLDIEGEVAAPFRSLAGEVDFELPLLQFPAGPEPSLTLANLAGQLRLREGRYELEARALASGYGLENVELALLGHGTPEDFEVERLQLDGQEVTARASGRIVRGDSVSVVATVDLQRLALNPWWVEWPAGEALEGRFRLAWEGDRVYLDDIDLEVSGRGTTLRGTAEVETDGGRVTAKVGWNGLSWPLGAESPWFVSESGELDWQGLPEDWLANGALALRTPDYPGGRFVIEARGAADTITVHIDEGEALGGRVAGEVVIRTGGELEWNADLRVRDIDTSHLAPEWPTRASGQLTIGQDAGGERLTLAVRDLLGQYQGTPFSGGGGLVTAPGELHFRDFQLRSEGSELLLNGSLQGANGLSFRVDVAGPGLMADLLGGQWRGQGRLAPQARPPRLELALEGSGLEWGELKIARLQVTPLAEPGAPPLALAVEFTGLNYGTVEIPSGRVTLQGDQAGQTIGVQLVDGERELSAEISGALDDWTRLPASDWAGEIRQLQLHQEPQPLLSLDAPATLELRGLQWSLRDACVQLEGSGRVCATVARDAKGAFDLAVDLHSVPLQYSQYFVDHELALTQRVDGRFSWRQEPGRRPSGAADITVSAGRLGDIEAGDSAVETGEGFLGFRMEEGDLVEGQVDLPLPGIGEIDADFRIAGVQLDGTGIVDGRLRVRLDDIASLESLTASVEGLHGGLLADLQVAGPLKDPALSGTVALSDGQFDYPLLGTRLRDIQLQGSVDNRDVLHLEGGFLAGEGRGRLDLTGDFSELTAPGFDLVVTGKRLRLVDAPDMRLDVDANVASSWRDSQLRLNGDVHIPYGRVALATTLASKVTESRDVVVVAGKRSASTAAGSDDGAELLGKLRVTIGDDVRLATEVAQLELGGAVDLEWKAESQPRANGAISLAGDIHAFGPALRVREGYVRFNNTRLNNPVLEIRAERDVFGNTQVRAAGVSITGTARRPVVEAYTRPLTTRDRAWTLLITGQDFNHGQGIGALDVGTYIAPRLFISYGLSLFDDENVVSARYDLDRGFGIKATTGQRDTGVDISYTIDRE